MNIQWLPMTPHHQAVMINKAEAPKGYYPILKVMVYNHENTSHMYPNICASCEKCAVACPTIGLMVSASYSNGRLHETPPYRIYP